MQRALVVGMSLGGLDIAGMADGLVPPAAEGATGSTEAAAAPARLDPDSLEQ